MDVMKEFEEHYLEKWAKEKHQPVPTRNNMDRWNVAWADFVKEVLVTNYDEISQEYRDMEYKTMEHVFKEKIEKEKEKAIEEQEQPIEPEKSDWEKVQELLNKNT